MKRFYILHFGPTGCKIEGFGRQTTTLPKTVQELEFSDFPRIYNHHRKCSASKYANNIQKRVPNGVHVTVVGHDELMRMCGLTPSNP